jgi:hypothetical protein
MEINFFSPSGKEFSGMKIPVSFTEGMDAANGDGKFQNVNNGYSLGTITMDDGNNTVKINLFGLAKKAN